MTRGPVVLTVALAAVFTASAWADDELHGWTDGLLVAANVAPLLLVRRNPLAVACSGRLPG